MEHRCSLPSAQQPATGPCPVSRLSSALSLSHTQVYVHLYTRYLVLGRTEREKGMKAPSCLQWWRHLAAAGGNSVSATDINHKTDRQLYPAPDTKMAAAARRFAFTTNGQFLQTSRPSVLLCPAQHGSGKPRSFEGAAQDTARLKRAFFAG